MSVVLNAKLADDAKTIDLGIRYLQNEFVNVVNRYAATNEDTNFVLEKHANDLSAITSTLEELVKEQKEMDTFLKKAERQLTSTENELKQLTETNNIHPNVWNCKVGENI